MKLLAAYCLCILGGSEANTENISKIITAVGGEVDEAKLEALITSLSGEQDIHELLAKGEESLKSIVGVSVSTGSSAAPAAAAAPAQEKKPEKPKDEEVDVLDGGMSMFSGGASAASY